MISFLHTWGCSKYFFSVVAMWFAFNVVKNTCCLISSLNSLRCMLWPRRWSVWVSVPWELEKNGFPAIVRGILYKCQPDQLMDASIQLTIFLLSGCLAWSARSWKKVVRVFNSKSDLFSAPFSSISFTSFILMFIHIKNYYLFLGNGFCIIMNVPDDTLPFSEIYFETNIANPALIWLVLTWYIYISIILLLTYVRFCI